MKTGILADIHGHVEYLRVAIDRLEGEGVDSFVVLGDVIYNRGHAAETVAVLKDCGAVGVFGNHELGLCVDPGDELRASYGDVVLEFFGTLAPQFALGDLLFSHTLPDQDATDPLSYYLGPRPEEEGALDGCFSRFPHRRIMVGHFHRWFAATPAGRIDWDGGQPIELDPEERYFFVVHAVTDGWAAILDEELNVLTPVRL